jgi:hypothetical protein
VPAIDYGLAVAGPLHGHIAMNFVRAPGLCLAHPAVISRFGGSGPVLTFAVPPLSAQVITDYVPVAGRMASRAGLLGLSCASVAGLMKLNADGPGITATLKRLWHQ